MLQQYIKQSVIVSGLKAMGGWVQKKWSESKAGFLFTRDVSDAKTKNSFFGRVANACASQAGSFALSGRALTLANTSPLFRLATHFEYGVFAILFFAPFLPTMACVVLVMLSFLSYLAHQMLYGASTSKVNAEGFLLALLMIVFGFYAVTSLTPGSSLRIFMVYAPFMAFPFLVVRAATDEKRLRQMLFVFLTSGLIVSLYGIYQQFFGTNLGHAWLDDEMFTEISIRVYSTFGNPNVLGEYLLLVLPLAAAMMWCSKGLLTKLYYGGIFGISAVCMILTQSRGCWLGLLLAAFVFALLVDRRLLLLAVVGAFVLPFVLPSSVVMRFLSIGDVSDSSTSYRLYIWLGTLNMLKDFWVFGIGLGSDAYNKIYPFYSYSSIIAPHAHNLYLQLLCETGVVGLGTFLLFLLVTFKKLLLGWMNKLKPFERVLCGAVIAGLCGFLLQGMFDYVWYNYRVFLIFWVFIGLGFAAKKLADSSEVDYN